MNVMCAANSGFGHASAPDRRIIGEAQVMYLLRYGVAAYTTNLNVDNPSGI